MGKNKTTIFAFFLFLNIGVTYIFNIKIPFEQILITHAFLSILSFFIEAIRLKIKQSKTTNPYILLSVNFFRALITVVFLITINLNYVMLNKRFVVNFIVCYFIYLVIAFIKNKSSNPKKQRI
tara:strand:+ start:544 stop:912 length:369 start_codon:yes stop_codon:yes gene_type:complete